MINPRNFNRFVWNAVALSKKEVLQLNPSKYTETTFSEWEFGVSCTIYYWQCLWEIRISLMDAKLHLNNYSLHLNWLKQKTDWCRCSTPWDIWAIAIKSQWFSTNILNLVASRFLYFGLVTKFSDLQVLWSFSYSYSYSRCTGIQSSKHYVIRARHSAVDMVRV